MRLKWLGIVAGVCVLTTPWSMSGWALTLQQRSYRIERLDEPTLRICGTTWQLGVLEKLNRRDLEHVIRLEERPSSSTSRRGCSAPTNSVSLSAGDPSARDARRPRRRRACFT